MEIDEQNESWRVSFYLEMEPQDKNKIEDLVEAGHCVVVGDSKWKTIVDFRDEDLEDNENLEAHGFDFKDTCKADRFDFMNLTQHLWYGYWYEHLGEIN